MHLAEPRPAPGLAAGRIRDAHEGRFASASALRARSRHRRSGRAPERLRNRAALRAASITARARQSGRGSAVAFAVSLAALPLAGNARERRLLQHVPRSRGAARRHFRVRPRETRPRGKRTPKPRIGRPEQDDDRRTASRGQMRGRGIRSDVERRAAQTDRRSRRSAARRPDRRLAPRSPRARRRTYAVARRRLAARDRRCADRARAAIPIRPRQPRGASACSESAARDVQHGVALARARSQALAPLLERDPPRSAQSPPAAERQPIALGQAP